jgi:hypothetical protein
LRVLFLHLSGLGDGSGGFQGKNRRNCETLHPGQGSE